MKHSIVRQTIVETASHLFYQNGYNLTGINEIIKEAGIAKATLYNHFKSKNDICLAYLDYKDKVFTESIKSFMNELPQGENQILGLFDFLTSFFQDKNFNGCWCINTVSEIPKENEEVKSKIKKQKNGLITFINELTDNAFKSNTEKENKTLAKQIYLLYESAVSESFLHQSDWPINEAKSLCKKIIA